MPFFFLWDFMSEFVKGFLFADADIYDILFFRTRNNSKDVVKMDFKELMEKIAEQNGTTATDVYAEIQKAINLGLTDQDEQVQENWKKIPREEEIPSPEEVIQYLVERVLAGDGDVCDED